MKKLLSSVWALIICYACFSQSPIVTPNPDGSLRIACPVCPPPVIIRDTVWRTNVPPAANAGPDLSITLPQSSVTLNGSGTDLDGRIEAYTWSRIAGPTTFTFGGQFSAVNLVSNLVEGTYTFRLTVTDDKGGPGYDDINITVLPSVVVIPPTGTTTTLSFVQLTSDFQRPAAGSEQWNGAWQVPIYGTVKPLDKYYRFPSNDFFTSTGTYSWSVFDREANAAFTNGQKFSFGIMTVCPGCDLNRVVSFDGGRASYPLSLHKLMQAEPVKDFKTAGGDWVVNVNSPSYIAWLNDLNKSVNDHIVAMGWKGRIGYVDIRGYGAWGEWHSGGGIVKDNLNDYPAGTRPTLASLKEIVDAHTKNFPDFPLVAMIAAFDRGFLDIINNPPEIAYYILTQRNKWGLIGWRRDQWMATDAYLKVYLENNDYTVNGMLLKTEIMKRWRYAPIVGEPPGWVVTYKGFDSQIKLYGASSFGNGNYGTTSLSTTEQNYIKAASAAAGYKLSITGGSVTTGSTTTIKLNWTNLHPDGQERPPTYEDWDVIFAVNGVTIGKSSFNPRMFTGKITTTDSFTGVPAGKLTIKIVDPDGFEKPMPLAIPGQNPDGSYTLIP